MPPLSLSLISLIIVLSSIEINHFFLISIYSCIHSGIISQAQWHKGQSGTEHCVTTSLIPSTYIAHLYLLVE
jgi:hypothetical protein